MLVFVFAAKLRLFSIGCMFWLLFYDFSEQGLTVGGLHFKQIKTVRKGSKVKFENSRGRVKIHHKSSGGFAIHRL